MHEKRMRRLPNSLAISATLLCACGSATSTDRETGNREAGIGERSRIPSSQPASSSPPADAKPEVLLPRDDLLGLKNFARVSDALCRGAQPTAEGMAELKRLGIKTVVNLRTFHSDRGELRGLGLRHAHIHCKTWHPEEEDIVRFLSIVLDPANQPVFVHCQYGSDRTGMMVAAYRVAVQGWNPEQAAEELPRFGFHELWKEVRERVSNLDAEALRKRVEAASRETLPVVD